MKAASVKEIKTELINYSQKDLVDICLKLSRFKKENKELLTYLLYEAADEANYILNVKNHIDHQFENINRKSYYFIKKSVRKILKEAKKYIRYSKKTETEVELLLYFCEKMKDFTPSIERNRVLKNIFLRQLEYVQAKIEKLHEDLQFDYKEEIKTLLED